MMRHLSSHSTSSIAGLTSSRGQVTAPGQVIVVQPPADSGATVVNANGQLLQAQPSQQSMNGW